MAEPSGPCGHVSSIADALHRASGVAHDADVRSGVIVPLARKPIPRPPEAKEVSPQWGTASGPRCLADVDGAARTYMRDLLTEVSAMKNVPLSAEELAANTETVLDQLSFEQRYQLSGFEKAGVYATVAMINLHLDALAISRIYVFVSRIEGRAISDPIVEEIVSRIVAPFATSINERRCVQWPHPADLVRADYRCPAEKQVEVCDA